jgi:hypothetical protein
MSCYESCIFLDKELHVFNPEDRGIDLADTGNDSQ